MAEDDLTETDPLKTVLSNIRYFLVKFSQNADVKENLNKEIAVPFSLEAQ